MKDGPPTAKVDPDGDDGRGDRVSDILRSASRGPSLWAVGAGSADLSWAFGTHHALPWASVTKLLTTWAVLVAVEEGSVALEDPVGPPGATLESLLAHASGLPTNGRIPVTGPHRRRIYSNTGIVLAAEHLAERTGFTFDDYVTEAVLEPLAMASTSLGSPATGARGTLTDLAAFAREVAHPTLIDTSTRDDALRPRWPSLSGVLPGFGSQTPNPWGVGFEIRDAKTPHWTGTANSPATVGHFGQSGSFLWWDPAVDVWCVFVCDQAFGPWAADAWPRISDLVLSEFS